MGRYSREQWLDWLLKQPESGLSIADFCDSVGVSANSFYVWKRKLRSKLRSAKRKRRKTATPLVPVEIVEPHDGANHVVVELPCGAAMKVPADVSSLRLVLQTLLEIGGQS